MKRAFTFLVATACAVVVSTTVPSFTLAAARATAITPENAGRVVELKRIGEPTVNSAVISPDGRLVAVATSLAIELRDAARLNTIIRTLEGGTAFQNVAFSPDGQLVAGKGRDGAVYIWQVADGRLKQRFQGVKSQSSQIAFSKNIQTLTILSENHLEIWSINGRLIQLSNLRSYGYALSYEGNRVATLNRSDFITVIDTSGSILYSVQIKSAPVSYLALSTNGQFLAIASNDGLIRVHSVEKGNELFVFQSETFNLAFSLDDRYLASFDTREGKIIIFDLASGEKLMKESQRLNAFSGSGTLSFSRDGKLLRADKFALRLLQVPSANPLSSFGWTDRGAAENATLSADGELLLLMVADSPNAQLIQVSDGRLSRILSSGVNSWSLKYVPIAISPNKNFAAFSLFASPPEALPSEEGFGFFDNFKTILFVNHLNKNESFSLIVPVAGISSLSFSPDEQLLACGSVEGVIYLLRASNGTTVRTLSHSKSEIRVVSFSSDGRFIAAASSDGVVRIWQIPNGRLVRELPKSLSSVITLAFSQDSKLIATAGEDYLVQIWRVDDGEKVYELDGHSNTVKTIAFSSDNTVLATGDLDGTIRLWRISDGRLLKDIKAHTDAVLTLAFNKSGQIATFSVDNTIRLWGVK